MITALKDVLDAIDGDERFVMTALAGFANLVLILAGVIGPTEYVTLSLGTVAVFIGGSAYSAGVQSRADAQVAMYQGAPWEGEDV